MNRRNFLKLFGLLAIPTSAIGGKLIKTPPSFQQMRVRKKKKKREINLYITLENRFHEVHGKHRIIIYRKFKDGKYHAGDYGDWSDTFLMHGRHVNADDLITVETQNGTSITFDLIPNPYQEGKFETMNITTELNGWNYELEATPIL